MRGDGGESDDSGVADDSEEGGAPSSGAQSFLRPLPYGPPPVGDLVRPAVRLRREYKGPTAADLENDEFVSRLPGQVRSAVNALARGDLADAEAQLPGEFGRVLSGPGSQRRKRIVRVLWAWLLLGAALLGLLLVFGV